MNYIDSGEQEGATIHLGGECFGDKAYFINPTIFTNTKLDMKIVREEIFGPAGVWIRFNDEAGERRYPFFFFFKLCGVYANFVLDVIRQANDTSK